MRLIPIATVATLEGGGHLQLLGRDDMSKKTIMLRPGFLKLDPIKILWVSFPCRRLNNLEFVLRKDLGIVGRRYTQFHNAELDPIVQEDILDMQAYCMRNGYRIYGILINEMASKEIINFFAKHSIPFDSITLTADEESFHKALVATLKYVSIPR